VNHALKARAPSCRPKELRSSCFLNSPMQTRSCPCRLHDDRTGHGNVVDVVRFLNLAEAVLFSDAACRSKVSEIRQEAVRMPRWI
jgi:hypothetical protein